MGAPLERCGDRGDGLDVRGRHACAQESETVLSAEQAEIGAGPWRLVYPEPSAEMQPGTKRS